MILELPPQSYVAWRTFITLFHVIAASSTVFRIKERYRNRQMGLDDYLVILPMTVTIVYSIIPWILPSVSPDPRTAQHSDYINSWAAYLFSFTIIWISRICFTLSLARIFPPGKPSRSRIRFISWFFAILYCICIILAVLHCDDSSNSHCVVFQARYPAMTYVYTADAFSIILMVACSLVLLWRIKLQQQDKCIIFAALSGSTMTLLVFGVLFVFTYAPFRRSSASYVIVTCMLWNLTAAASLLSSNVLVIVTTILRVHYGSRGRSEVGDLEQDAPRKAKSGLFSTMRATSIHESGPSVGAGRLSTTQSPSETSSPAYSLTDISMEEFDSQNRPPDLSYHLPNPPEVSLAPDSDRQLQQLAHRNHCLNTSQRRL